jgi:hypothetical protein
MAQSDFGSRVAQFPANGGGTLGQNLILATASIHIGTGGMPVPTRNYATGIATGLNTVYGFEGLTATLVGTGLYEVGHPPANVARVFPQYVGPSGHTALVTPQRSVGNSASGVVRLQVSPNQAMSTGMTPPSGAISYPFNPPSGTRLDLLFFINPRNDQGITQY